MLILCEISVIVEIVLLSICFVFLRLVPHPIVSLTNFLIHWLYYVMLCFVLLCCVMLCYVMLLQVTSRRVKLCYYLKANAEKGHISALCRGSTKFHS
jgi:drug/metabolite transporter (DMT)-like permease